MASNDLGSLVRDGALALSFPSLPDLEDQAAAQLPEFVIRPNVFAFGDLLVAL